MEQLVIRLGSHTDQPVHWLVWSSEQSEIIASGELPDASELSTLRDRAGNRPIIALAPGSDILLKQLELPAKAARKAMSAIPFMLEDEVGTDIDSAFFAMGGSEGELQNIAVVQKEKLEGWLKLLDDAGLVCNKLIPDVLALPSEKEGWAMMTLGDNVIVRQGSWQGIQGESEWVYDAISHYAKHQEEKVLIHCMTEINIPAIPNVELESDLAPLPMEVLTRGALSSSFNLLQGQYTPKKAASGTTKQWRLAAILAGLALTVTVADKAIQVNQLSQQKEQLQTQIKGHFQRAFPETKRIVNVRSQMRKKLKELEGKGGSTSMLVMLTQLSSAFSTSKVTPQTLRFDQGRSELRLQAIANNYEALERFKTLAEQQGFQVEQGAINNRDNKVMGPLIIRS